MTRSTKHKRGSIIGRIQRLSGSHEKRALVGSESITSKTRNRNDDCDDASEASSEAAEPRRLFFNDALPKELLDDEGEPVQHFPRNKIRTAKYTALSFVPKNLWFQFHNVANIYFLFVVILVVSTVIPAYYLMMPMLDPLPTKMHRFSLFSAQLTLDFNPSP